MPADRITSAERAERQRRVEEAEHGAEMEGVQVTEQWRADAARYVAGEIDTDELVAITQARYGLLVGATTSRPVRPSRKCPS